MCGKLEYWEYQKMKLSNLHKKSSSLGQRFYTLELALNLFIGFESKNIVQVGCQSKEFEYANFDLFNIFADFTLDNNFNYTLYVNRDDPNLTNRIQNIERDIYKKYNTDQVSILDINREKEKEKIDLLILNDICYPINEITKKLNNKLNYLEARNILHSFTEEDLDDKYGELINPCREKMVEEYKIFSDYLNKSSIVLLEGNDYPGGSQTSYVKDELIWDNFTCLLDLKQSIWMRS